MRALRPELSNLRDEMLFLAKRAQVIIHVVVQRFLETHLMGEQTSQDSGKND